MKKIYVAVAISLVTGFAAGAIVLRSTEPEPLVDGDADRNDYFDQTAATEQRIRALEAAVAEERNARQLLEEELQLLFEDLDQLTASREAAVAAGTAQLSDEEQRQQRVQQMQRRAERRQGGSKEALINSGFTPERADWLLQRESELQLESMQARFDARRSGNALDASMSPDSMLRAEIGDAEYEKYLQAYDRSTTVGVGNVIESSPGQIAGLQAGDRIVSYAGERVFSYSDLSHQTLRGEPGESVVVDILRDDIPMQVVLPRGPIGIQSSRFRRR